MLSQDCNGAAVLPGNAIPEGRILDAAYDLLLAVGMRRMTMADVARRAEVQHALILGCTLLITNVPNTISRWREFPVWLHLASALVIVPAAVLGGYLRSRQMEGRRDSFVQVR